MEDIAFVLPVVSTRLEVYEPDVLVAAGIPVGVVASWLEECEEMSAPHLFLDTLERRN